MSKPRNHTQKQSDVEERRAASHLAHIKLAYIDRQKAEFAARHVASEFKPEDLVRMKGSGYFENTTFMIVEMFFEPKKDIRRQSERYVVFGRHGGADLICTVHAHEIEHVHA